MLIFACQKHRSIFLTVLLLNIYTMIKQELIRSKHQGESIEDFYTLTQL